MSHLRLVHSSPTKHDCRWMDKCGGELSFPDSMGPSARLEMAIMLRDAGILCLRHARRALDGPAVGGYSAKQWRTSLRPRLKLIHSTNPK